MSEKYNGWTNYATWRINLEIFDGMDAKNLLLDTQYAFTRFEKPELSDVAEYLSEYVDSILCESSAEGLTLDYARAFVSQVNWHEIAQHLLDDVQQDEEESEE